MIEKKKRSPTTSTNARDLRTVRNFIEELSWLLNSTSKPDFKAMLRALDQATAPSSRLGRHVSKNPNIHFLVGALPGIFNDLKYFPTNEDIVQFAQQALKLEIGRWEKRSRYELIGLVVCETAKLDDVALERLADVLSRIVADDQSAKALFQDRTTNRLSWNEIIQQLSRST